MPSNDKNELTALQILKYQLRKKTSEGLVYPVTVRLQVGTLSLVDALAERMNFSRTLLVNKLLEIALPMVISDLDRDAHIEIHERSEELLQDYGSEASSNPLDPREEE
jgi:hypothetical protein